MFDVGMCLSIFTATQRVVVLELLAGFVLLLGIMLCHCEEHMLLEDSKKNVKLVCVQAVI